MIPNGFLRGNVLISDTTQPQAKFALSASCVERRATVLRNQKRTGPRKIGRAAKMFLISRRYSDKRKFHLSESCVYKRTPVLRTQILGCKTGAVVFLCVFCKFLNGLGRRSQVCGFEPRRWHFTTNVRMCNFSAFYAFTHSHIFAKMPYVGVEPTALAPAAQTLTQLAKWGGEK